jgi:hypothetical protein
MADVTVLADSIIGHQQNVDEYKNKIKSLFDDITFGLVQSNNIITKEIENKYKEIDSTFNKKSKHEQSILELKRQIFKELNVG